jgi:hypothetical protein
LIVAALVSADAPTRESVGRYDPPCGHDEKAVVMPDEEEGTTEFRARGLKDLLESQEAPPKPAGGDKNRRLAIIGGGVGAVVVVVLAAVLLGGGGGDKGGGGSGTGVAVGLEMRPSAAVGIEPGNRISVCDSEAGPVAEDVVVKEIKPAKSAAGQDIVQLSVLAEGAEINALGRKAKSTWRAIGSTTCPAVETTATTTATTLAPVQPPASTPPDSTPTPPPS